MNLRRDSNIEILVPDALLHGYVDVLLSRAQCRAVETAIARDTGLAHEVEGWRRQNLGIQRLAMAHSPPPMPRKMRESVRRLSGQVHPQTISRSWPAALFLMLIATGAAVWLIGMDMNGEAKQEIPKTTLNQ